ncbi:MAG: hypothetical protein K0R81_132 [Microbacterium sp.]|nr:hypothetical protein [Microbacterium sp.]
MRLLKRRNPGLRREDLRQNYQLLAGQKLKTTHGLCFHSHDLEPVAITLDLRAECGAFSAVAVFSMQSPGQLKLSVEDSSEEGSDDDSIQVLLVDGNVETCAAGRPRAGAFVDAVTGHGPVGVEAPCSGLV